MTASNANKRGLWTGTSAERDALTAADGLLLGDEFWDTAGGKAWWDGAAWRKYTTGGRAHVRNIDGPGTTMISYDKSAVNATPQAIHFPSGSGITEITVVAHISADQANVTGQTLKIVLDAPGDVSATAMMAEKNSVSVPNGYISVPIGIPVVIPLTSELLLGDNGGGRLDIAARDATPTLDVWIGAN